MGSPVNSRALDVTTAAAATTAAERVVRSQRASATTLKQLQRLGRDSTRHVFSPALSTHDRRCRHRPGCRNAGTVRPPAGRRSRPAAARGVRPARAGQGRTDAAKRSQTARVSGARRAAEVITRDINTDTHGYPHISILSVDVDG